MADRLMLVAIHVGVRHTKQVFEPTFVVGRRHADGRGDPQTMATDLDRLEECVAQSLRHPVDIAGFEIGAEHGELIAAESPDGVPGADGSLQPSGHHRQDLVADVMSVGVVDRLEAVEVDEERGDRIMVVAQCGLGQAQLERPPVQDAGQVVGGGGPLQRAVVLGPGEGERGEADGAGQHVQVVGVGSADPGARHDEGAEERVARRREDRDDPAFLIGVGRRAGPGRPEPTEEPLDAVDRRVEIDLVLPDYIVDDVVEAIVRAASTGAVGDGKIFLSKIDQAIRIRNQQIGAAALLTQ